MRKLICILILLFGLGTATATEKETLIVTNSKAWKPFSYIDESGKPSGILIDLWSRYAEVNRIDVEFYLTDWNDSLLAVKDGRADVHAGLLWSESRDRFLDYSDQFMTIDTQLFFSRNLMGSDVNLFLEGQHHYPVGVVRGGYEEEFVRTQFPEVEVTTYPNNEDMIMDAFAGNIQAFVADLQVANFFLYSDTDPSQFIGVRHLYSGKLRPAVAEGNSDLQSLIRYGMAQVTDQEKHRIFSKWMYINTVYPDYLWPVVILLSAFVAISYILMLRMTVRARTKQLQQANLELKSLSETDPLTSLTNRRFFFESFKLLKDNSASIVVMVFDIDDFKRINDNYGHDYGDSVIRSVAKAAKSVLGPEILISRIGGEEFAIAINGASTRKATKLAHNLCSAVRLVKHPLPDSGDLTVTISVGCAIYKACNSQINLSDADQLMYSAKSLGKDRAVVKVIASENKCGEPEPQI